MDVALDDFTVLEVVWIERLALATVASFVLLTLPRVAYLVYLPNITGLSTRWLFGKLAAATILASLRLGLLAIVVPNGYTSSPNAVAPVALDVVASLLLLILLPLEHFKCNRPSMLAGAYLLCALIYDLIRTTLLWTALQHGVPIDQINTARGLLAMLAVVECVLLLLVSVRLQRWIPPMAVNGSPEETSGIISLGLYAWLTSLFWKGYQAPLAMHNLFSLDPAISVKSFHAEVDEARSMRSKGCTVWQLLMWLCKPLGRSAFLPVIPRLCLLGFTFSQPFFLQHLLDNLSEAGNGSFTGPSMIVAAALIYFGIAISTSLYWYYQERFQSSLRGYLVSSIYRKTTRLPHAGSGDLAAVTLMSADVDRIYTGLRFMHETWVNVIQIALTSWMLYKQLGLAFLSSFVLVILGFAGSFLIARRAVVCQSDWMKSVEKRTGMTAAILANVKDVRVSGLTHPATELVQQQREDEIRVGERSRVLIAISASLSQVPAAMAPSLTFLFGPRMIKVTRAYTALSLITLSTAPLLIVLQTMPIVAACIACLRRIKGYCDKQERLDRRRKPASAVPGQQNDNHSTITSASITVKEGSFGWTSEKCALKQVNMSIARSSITFVIGPVGAGKSTLCKAILGEIPYAHGMIILESNKLAYCAQTPFLFNNTIRSNIVGFATFNAARYAEIVEATCLTRDFADLPSNDMTLVGTKGMSLSGGQRQRVSLARALYQEADILILDDVFSGLDGHTQDQLCQSVLGMNGLVRRRKTTVLICTHATHLLPIADQVILLSSGGSLTQMSYEEYERSKDSSLSPVVTNRDSTTRTAILQDSLHHQEGQEPKHREPDRRSTIPDTLAPLPQCSESGKTVYGFWLSTIGPLPLILYALLIVGIGFCSNFSIIWLQIWSADSVSRYPTHSFAFWIGMYSLLGVGTILCVFSGGLIMLRTAVRLAGTGLHRSTLKSAMQSSLRFLSVTDSGKILNLFSQDINILDTQLPRMVNNMCICLSMAIGQAVVIAASSAWLAMSYPVLLAILWVVQRIYLPTSKRLRLLDLEAKAPLYTEFTDLITGMPTLRAFGWLPQQVARNDELLDESQRPSYLLAMAQQWLTLTMNIIVAILAIILVVLATRLDSNTGNVGAALITLITFGGLLSTVIVAYTGLETSLGAVSRLKSFSEETEQEDARGAGVTPDVSWPIQGRVVIKATAASYNGSHKVLSRVDLKIDPGQKVALCGRTGSGKSTIIALLLRLIEPSVCDESDESPLIAIDGLPLQEINHALLRERVIADSQSPVFLPEETSFHANLDPWAKATRDECNDALRDTGLAEIVEANGGLDGLIGGAELSAGQKQLFSVARVVLRRRVKFRTTGIDSGLLLLDEITSSVDTATASCIRQILMAEFAAYTVVMVTHQSDIDTTCDRVITLENGRIVQDLLQPNI